MGQFHGNRVSKLPHGFPPRTFKLPSIGKGLDSSGFTNREVSVASIPKIDHVLTPGNPVVTGFQGLGGKVKGTSRVARIGTSPQLETMVKDADIAVEADEWFGEVGRGLTQGHPGPGRRSTAVRNVLEAHRHLPGCGARGDPQPFPILTRHKLVEEEPVQRVCRRREGPMGLDVRPEAHKEDTLPRLRNAEVGRVQNLAKDIVLEALAPPVRGGLPFQPRQVFGPLLVVTNDNLGKSQLKDGVLKVVGKGPSSQAANVLHQERSGPGFPNAADKLGNHVTTIIHSLVLPSEREGLARRTTGNKIDAIETIESLTLYVSGNQDPLPLL